MVGLGPGSEASLPMEAATLDEAYSSCEVACREVEEERRRRRLRREVYSSWPRMVGEEKSKHGD